jgi:transcription elongation GreA/GreB family factor
MTNIQDLKEDIRNKIIGGKSDIEQIEQQIEEYRNSNIGDDDNLVVQELEEKRDMLKSQILELNMSMQNLNLENSLKEYKVRVNNIEKTIIIVPASVANPTIGHISEESPLGKALSVANKGEKIEIKKEDGNTITYEIL